MSTVAEKFSTVSTKVKVGAAAAALTGAAAFGPAMAAQADVAIPAPTAPAMTEISNLAAAPVINTVSFAEQAGWIWFGPQRDDAPPISNYFVFKPLVLVPGFLQPFFGWTANLNFEACVFGFSISVGPYGTISAGVSRGC